MDITTHRDEIEAWLTLLRAPRIGASKLREFVERHGDALRTLHTLRNDASIDAACRSALRKPPRDAIESDLAWLANDTHALITIDRDDYPALLRETNGAPPALFVAGDASLLWRPQIAIVGSRNASRGGADNAQQFARALCAAGLAITSGLAEGIDAIAHTTALDANACTIAVLGTGPDLVFPRRHRALAERILECNGALVSEFPPGTPGLPEHFPRRNRIIAGLALATLVVEAGVRSGSLITARCAADQGREVFAIPGSIHHPLARGCHRLIREGATLVETAEEIIEALGPLATQLGFELRRRLAEDAPTSSGETRPIASADVHSAAIIAALGHDALGIDALAARTALDVRTLTASLLLLELDGAITCEPGGVYVRRFSVPQESRDRFRL